MSKSKARDTFCPKLITLAVASCFAASAALANPKTPTVVSGTATFNQSGNLLEVTNSNRAIINWQSFSIGANEITRFLQQNASSAVMNRVTLSNPSMILGTLQSNGRVFLINPSGIVFGAGAQVDVAGLVASSLNLSDQDFLQGRMKFSGGMGAPVLNQGNITTGAGGEVYLVGKSVTNSGVITTPKGEVVLAAGNSVELVNPGTPALRVEISAANNEARNLGHIVADAGRVGIYAGLINHSGTIRADGAQVTDDGRIVLKATKNVTLEAGSVTSANGPKGGTIEIQSGDTTIVAGTVEATGSAGKGGTVRVLGNQVGLVGDAKVDVSGDTGGGTVLVGGDFQGKNPNVQNAFRTFFGPDASIRADAITNGDGGKVIIWSDDATRAYGTISAKGGSQSGNGGFVEVSSKGWLDFHAKVDLRAPKGKAGTLLLDPNDVELCSDCSNVNVNFDGGEGSPGWYFSVGGGTSEIDWNDVDINLANGDVIITTSGPGSQQGNITVQDSFNYNRSNKLQLVAHNNINVDNDIINDGTGEIRFYAGWINDNGTIANAINPVVGASGNININNGSTVQTGGNIFMKAGHDINVFDGGRIYAGTGGPGNWRITLDAGNRLHITGGSEIEAKAGGGGTTRIDLLAGAGGILIDGGEGGSPFIFANSNENINSPGGSALIIMSTVGGGNITISDAEVVALGGNASGNASGGAATVSVQSSGSLAITDSFILAQGGEGSGTGNGGNASVLLEATGNLDILGSTVAASGGDGGFNGGDGGFGFMQLIADGNITISDSFVGGEGGFAFNGGIGGAADILMSAGGNINVQNAGVIAEAGGAEGGIGGAASILMTANGSITVGGEGVVAAVADSGCCGDRALFGGDADVTMIANGILINESSAVRADGGEGTLLGGFGSVGLFSTGSINISGADFVGSFGGRATDGIGGDALTMLVADGSISVTETSGFAFTNFGGFGIGVFAVAGRGDGPGGIGGNAGVIYLAGSGILHRNSHTEAISGTGLAGSGVAVTALETLFGNISILADTPPEDQPLTVLACANTDCNHNQGGFAEVFLEAGGPTGKIIIVNEIVEAVGSQAFINLSFPGQPGPEGGWSVNGVEGAITGSPVGFFVNGEPAIPGVNFFVQYGPSSAPVGIDAPVLKGIDDILAIFKATESEPGTDTPGNDKKKKGDGDCR